MVVAPGAGVPGAVDGVGAVGAVDDVVPGAVVVVARSFPVVVVAAVSSPPHDAAASTTATTPTPNTADRNGVRHMAPSVDRVGARVRSPDVADDARPEHRVALRGPRRSDLPWLAAVGLDPEKIGSQYHWVEAPLQLGIAPARALLATRRPVAVVEVDGRRAGYIGPNPLSRNLEYFVQPWARGGVGAAIVAGYLDGFRAGDRPRRFFVSSSNERSMRTLRTAFDRLGWAEGLEVRVEPASHGSYVWVPAGPPVTPRR